MYVPFFIYGKIIIYVRNINQKCVIGIYGNRPPRIRKRIPNRNRLHWCANTHTRFVTCGTWIRRCLPIFAIWRMTINSKSSSYLTKWWIDWRRWLNKRLNKRDSLRKSHVTLYTMYERHMCYHICSHCDEIGIAWENYRWEICIQKKNPFISLNYYCL